MQNTIHNKLEGFDIQSGVLIKYTGLETYVAIPDEVKKIGAGAFKGLPITRVVFSKDVTVIAANAFEDCTELGDIVFNEGLVEIETKAFARCEKITNVLFPDSLKVIGENAFRNCCSIRSLGVSAGIEKQFLAFPINMKLEEIILSDAISYDTYTNGILPFEPISDNIIKASPKALESLHQFQALYRKNTDRCANCGGNKCALCGKPKRIRN